MLIGRGGRWKARRRRMEAWATAPVPFYLRPLVVRDVVFDPSLRRARDLLDER